MDSKIPPLRPRPPNSTAAHPYTGRLIVDNGAVDHLVLEKTSWSLLYGISVQSTADNLHHGNHHLTSLDDRQQMHPRPPPAPSHSFVPSKENQAPLLLFGNHADVPPWSTSGIPPWSTATRPLSDIRELTEPSLIGSTRQRPSIDRKPSKTSNKSATPLRIRSTSVKSSQHQGQHTHDDHTRGRTALHRPPSTPGDRSSCSSIYSIPLANVPPRSASKPRRQRSAARSVVAPAEQTRPQARATSAIGRQRSRSSAKQFAARFDSSELEKHERVPPRTFTRDPPPTEILDAPCHRHPRVSVDLHLSAPLFVGGGSIEGHVTLNVDDAERIRHKRAIALGRISIDLLGVEEMTAARRYVFLNLATELIDGQNPPPNDLVESLKQLSPIEPFWLLAPCITSLPFVLHLPLDIGPPPFQSKHACIRYIICVTLLIRDQGRQYLVRSSRDVAVLSVYDPEKALMSLPSPLTASDEYVRHRETSTETIKVTAGLHRQVWVSGTSLFVDVHISNHSRKSIRRIELQLERNILCYKHAAASTLEKSASQARIFDSNERSILIKTVYKQGTDTWAGISPHTSGVRTYDLELPRSHATVKCGKYFEVRFFLNITVGSAHKKLVTVQLPIVLIHMNSLDVVPNSVVQVAAAIEEKRATAAQTSLHPALGRSPLAAQSPRATANMHLSRKPSASVQGRAFAAPRMQFVESQRTQVDDLLALGQILDNSPRRYAAHPIPMPTPGSEHRIKRIASSFEYHTPPSNRKGRVLLDDEREEIHRRLRHAASVESNRTALSSAREHNNAPFISNPTAAIHKHRPSQSVVMSGFREAELEEGKEPMLGLQQGSSAVGNARGRQDASKTRNFQFTTNARTKSLSRERWKGLGWFARGDKVDEGCM